MADETSRRSLLLVIDPLPAANARHHQEGATRWIVTHDFTARTAANARRILLDLERACRMRIRSILSDNALCRADEAPMPG